jgi:hypothetical protein
MLAMVLPDYRAPAGAGTPDTLHTTVRGSTSLRILALGPDHVGRTASTQPTLYWHLNELPREAGRFELVIVNDDESGAELLSAPLSVDAPGLQVIRWADQGVRLAPGTTYKWSVSFEPDDDLSDVAYSMRWVELWQPGPEAARRLASASASERAPLAVETGLWYDALSELGDLIEAHPANQSLRSARRKLLEQGGIDPTSLGLDAD